MPSVFPGAIDNFTDPLTSSPLNSPSHAGQHQDLNDAVEKVEQYMGLVKVIPTGATNGTVGATGTVTIGNAVGSVTVSGAFSSLYDAYKVIITGGVGSTTQGLNLQLGATTTGYYAARMYVDFPTNTYGDASVNNGSNFSVIGAMTVNALSLDCNILNPFLAARTIVSSDFTTVTAAGEMQKYGGFLNDATSYTAFSIICVAGTMTGGSIRVYGYRN
jgi:hypothetical protein